MAAPGVGSTVIVYNTRERLVSTDHNREQAKEAQSLAEVFRFMFDAQNDLDIPGGGVEVLGSGSETQMRATVLNGLRVRPEVGTTNTFIEPGVAFMVDNAAPSIDESKLAWVIDPGVQVAGALPLAPGSGATRIDVIECQRVLSTLESDNRDVFNVGTGLFAPALVDKVKAGRLTYRIRQGTPGSGFPGIAAGWLPLAVASVPASATNWDAVDLWDVRPLASDRIAGFNSNPELPYVQRHLVYTDVITDPSTSAYLYGICNLSFGAYRAGGRILSTELGFIDIRDNQYWAPGFAFASNAIWYLYLVFPFNLPRWVRYSAAGLGARVPRGLRGIPSISAAAARFDGRPYLTSMKAPAWIGLNDGFTQNAIVMLAGRADNSGTPVPLGLNGDGRVLQLINPNSRTIAPFSSVGTTSVTFTLTDGTTHPANARAIYVRLHAEFATAGALRFSVAGRVDVSGGDADTTALTRCAVEGHHGLYEVSSAATCIVELTARVPLAPDVSFGTVPRVFRLRWTYATSSSTTPQDQTAEVVGWELGP